LGWLTFGGGVSIIEVIKTEHWETTLIHPECAKMEYRSLGASAGKKNMGIGKRKWGYIGKVFFMEKPGRADNGKV